MRRLATLAVVAALISPTVASGQDYSFGDWARDEGYSPGDVMPDGVRATDAGIDSLDGISEFDWTTTPTTKLVMESNALSSIESGDFIGLTDLTELWLTYNQISSIESGAFSGLTNLGELYLGDNQLSSIESGDFSGLTNLGELYLGDNQLSSIESGDFSGLTNLTTLSLVYNQISSIESGGFSGLTSLRKLDLGFNQISSIESGDFSGLTSLTELWLDLNQLSSIEPGAFSGLTNLTELWLGADWTEESNQLSSIQSGTFSGLTNLVLLELSANQLSSIEPGAFSGLTNLGELYLGRNSSLTELNLAEADFSSLRGFDVGDNGNITSVSLRNTVVNQTALATLLDGGDAGFGIGEVGDITKMDLSEVDFGNITDLGPLYVMDDLTDLWLVHTQNMGATDLDALLDNLETIEGTDTEGILHLTQEDFDAFNAAGGGLLATWHAESGHHVVFGEPLLGDLNLDGEVNGLDVDPFVDILLSGPYWPEADMNEDGRVNGLDVDPFVVTVGGGGAQQIPEPSALLLALIALGVVGGWRKWGG